MELPDGLDYVVVREQPRCVGWATKAKASVAKVAALMHISILNNLLYLFNSEGILAIR